MFTQDGFGDEAMPIQWFPGSIFLKDCRPKSSLQRGQGATLRRAKRLSRRWLHWQIGFGPGRQLRQKCFNWLGTGSWSKSSHDGALSTQIDSILQKTRQAIDGRKPKCRFAAAIFLLLVTPSSYVLPGHIAPQQKVIAYTDPNSQNQTVRCCQLCICIL